MVLQNLRTSLQKHIKNGSLELNKTTTGSAEIESLLKTIDPQGTLKLASVTLSPPDKPLTVTARGRFWNVDDSSITVDFEELDGTLLASVKAVPPATWTLKSSFPQLPPTSGLDQALLYKLKILQTRFSLSAPLPGTTPLLSLSVKADMQDSPEQLRQWLDADELVLEGPVRLTTDPPSLQLSARLPMSVGSAPVTLSEAELHITSSLDSRVSNTSTVTFGANFQLGLDIKLDLEGELNLMPGSPLRLSGNIKPVVPVSSLADLLGVISDDLVKNLGQSLNIQGLGLAALRIELRPAQKTLSQLSLEINNSGGAWLVGPQASPYFAVEDVSLDLHVHWPLDAGRRTLVAVVYGHSQFLERSFSVRASLPGPVVSATMTGQPIKLSQLLNANPLLPDGFSPEGLPQIDSLAIRSLAIELDADTGSIYFDGTLDGNLSLPLPGIEGPLEIESPQLALRANARDLSAAVLAFRGTANIAGAHSDINLVLTLKSVQFAIEVRQVKLSRLIEAQLGTQADLPDLTLERAFITFAGDRVSIGGALSTDFQIPVGNSVLSPRGVWASVDTSGQALSARLGGQAAFGRTRVGIDTRLEGRELILAGEVPRLNVAYLVEDLLGNSQGVPELQIDNITFDVSSKGAAHLSANDIRIDLTSMAARLGLQLPAGAPNPFLSLFKASVDDAGVLITLRCADELPFADGFGASEFEFKISHDKNTGLTVTLGFHAGGTVELADGCSLKLDVSFSGTSNGDFVADGTAQLSLFGTDPLTLDASLAREDATKFLVLDYGGPPLDLIDAKDVFALKVNSVGLTLVRDENETRFGLKGACSLGIGPLPVTDVTMSLHRDDGVNSLMLKADTDPLELPALAFPVPGNPPAVQMALRQLALSYAAERRQDNKSSLELSAAASLHLQNFAPVDSVMGNTFHGKLRVTSNSVLVACEINELQDKKWPRMSVRLSDKETIELPVPTIQAREIGLEIKKGKPSFASEWRVSVPQKLNALIGFDVFSAQFDMRLELGKSIALWPTGKPDWPLQKLQTEKIDGKQWLRLGELLVAIPRFELDGAAWMVRDLGVKGLRTFGIPMQPLKQILVRLMKDSKTATAIIERLPDSIPLGGINLDTGSLGQQIPALLGPAAVDKINELLKPTGESVDKILEAISGKVKKLPANLQEYLKVDVPDEAHLDIGVTTSGGANIALRVDPDQPLRLILPYMGMPPGLMGLTIHELRLGECAAGLLLMQGFDGYIDQFDFITLLAAVTEKEGGEHFAHRFTLNKVLAVTPSALPIPLPILFRELALDHVDWAGFELHSHWSFGPEEEFGLIQIIELILTIVPFFVDKDHFLHTEGHWPKSLELPFTIGPNNFGIPDYLGGGKPVGLPGKLPPYDASQSIAYLLDALKDVNPAYAIQAIPLKVEDGSGKRHWIRVNKLDAGIAFGPIELGADAAWCIATEPEFKGPISQYAVRDGILTPDALDNVFEALPKGATFFDRGFVIFIMGGWDLKSVAGMQCQFGIAYTREAGFQTGIRVSATLADTLAFSLGGTIQVKADRQYIEGSTQLLLTTDEKPTNLLHAHGEIEVASEPEKFFRVKVELQIGLMAIGGELAITGSSAALTGSLKWEDFVPDGQASVEFRSDGVIATVSGKLAQLSGSVNAHLPDRKAAMSIEFDSGFAQHVQQSIVDVAQREANATIDQAYRDLNEAISSIHTFSGSIGDLRKKAVPKICDTINSTIDKKINEIVKQEVDRRTPKRAPKFVKKRIERRAKSAANKKAKPYRDAVEALRKAAPRSNSETAKATRALIKQGQKKLYGVTPLKGNNLKKLNNLVDLIDRLEDNQKIKFDRESAFKSYKLADQIFARVRASTAEKIADAVPKIESLQATDISLAQAVPERLQAQLKFENAAPIAIDIYPRNAVKTSQSVAEAISKL